MRKKDKVAVPDKVPMMDKAFPKMDGSGGGVGRGRGGGRGRMTDAEVNDKGKKTPVRGRRKNTGK